MSKWTLNLGKVDANGRGRKVNDVTVEVELTMKKSPAPHLDIDFRPCGDYEELSMTGEIWNAARTDIIQGGPCLDAVAGFFPDNADVQKLVEIWRRWHLNGMRPGTREQLRHLDEFRVKDPLNQYNRDCEVLEKASLLMVGPQNYKNFMYGHGWLVEPLPPEIVQEVRDICGRLSPRQAEKPDDFASRNGITLEVKMVDENPNTEDRGANADNWKVTLKRGRQSMTTYFSKGIGHEGKKPTAIEILGSLASDAQGIDRDFEDWCGDYGYEADPRKARRIYNVIVKQTERLKAFLGTELFETLMEEAA